MHNNVSLNFLSKVENINFARNTCANFLHNLNPTISFIQEVKTIVSEAVTNAIIHGYNGEENHIVSMNLSYDEFYLTIEVIDQGIGIPNVEEARMPLFTTKQDSERSGLGFTIMEVFSDLFEVESRLNKGTKIIIKKKITKENEK